MVENVNIEMVSAPAPVSLDGEVPAHTPVASETERETRAYQEHLSQLARAIFNQLQDDSTGELSVKLSELGERNAALEKAISTGNPEIILQRANEVATYINANYHHFRAAIIESEQGFAEREKKGRELAAAMAEESMEQRVRAVEVERTRRYMNDNIEGFKHLREPAQNYFAQNTQSGVENDPFFKKASEIQRVIGEDEIIKEQKKKSEEAYKELMALAEQTHNTELKDQLLRMKDRIGKENLPELIDLNKKVQDDLKAGKTASDVAADATRRLKPHVQDCEHNGDIIQKTAYERLPDEMKNILKEKLGEDVTPEKLRALVEQYKKEGKLAPDKISDAVDRLIELRKQGKDFKDLSKEDQLLLAVTQQNLSVEMGKQLFGFAKHMAHLKEKDPKKYEELMNKYKDRVKAHDDKGLMQVMKESGYQTTGADTLETRTLLRAIADMSPEDSEKLLEHAVGAEAGDKEAGRKLREVFRDNVRTALEEKYNNDSDIAGKICRGVDFDNPEQRLLFNVALLKSTYHTADSPTVPDASKNGYFDGLVADVGDFFGWNNNALGSHQQVASIELNTLNAPAPTPKNEGTHAVQALFNPKGVG